MIDKSKITDTAFVSVAIEQIGLCVDFVYSYDEYEGWGDSVFLFLEEKYTSEDVLEAVKYANGIAEKYHVPCKTSGLNG